MDKSAIFVDAGYLLARGGLVVCGTHRRSEFDCAFEPLIDELNGLAGDHCELQPLRLYWYDGSRDRIPTPDHLEIGNLPYVKVRLGRIGAEGKQKGTSQFSLPAAVREDERAIKVDDVIAAGSRLGGEWAEKATTSEIQVVLGQSRIPREVDSQLLRDAGKQLGVARVPGELVGDLRSAFRVSLEQEEKDGSLAETAIS